MSFFEQPNKELKALFSRRAVLAKGLKSAAGITAFSALPFKSWSDSSVELNKESKNDPWLTLNAVLNHLLPASPSGPSAQDINALNYLYNVVHLQPTPQDEINFIYKGIGWLNSYSQSRLKQNFVDLTSENKEKVLKGIGRSRVGENWLSTLLDYLLEAMLTPPIYGGNPKGIGWQWLEHQGGFPLPTKGTRFYEIPSPKKNIIAQQAIKPEKLEKKA